MFPEVFVALLFVAVGGGEWSSFRGPGGQGIANGVELPPVFEEEHVLWRVPVGGGHSSPVIWEDRLFLTWIWEGEESREIVCVDAGSGDTVWTVDAPFEPHGQHRFNSFASSTPAVDEDGVYVVWSTGEELVALSLDLEGELRWERQLGSFAAQHGSASSPIVRDGVMIIANDNEGEESFLVALDAATGETRWRVERQCERASYATPLVIGSGDDKSVVFVSTAPAVTAIDLATGDVRYEVDLGLRQRCVATPCLLGDLLFLSAGSGGGGQECAVLELTGDPGTAPEVRHQPRQSLPYVPSTLGLDGYFYLVSDGGVASCLDAPTGDVEWRARLDGTFFSSPVSDGRTIYLGSREGTLFSIAPRADEFELLGSFDAEAAIFATPAIAGGRLFLRTADELICFGGTTAD